MKNNFFSNSDYRKWILKIIFLGLNALITETFFNCGVFMGVSLLIISLFFIQNLSIFGYFVMFLIGFAMGVLLLFLLNGNSKFIKQSQITKEICFKVNSKYRIDEPSTYLIEKEVSRFISNIPDDEFRKQIKGKKKILIKTHDVIIKKIFKTIKNSDLSVTITISGQVFSSYGEFRTAVSKKEIESQITSSNFYQLIPFLKTKCAIRLVNQLYSSETSKVDSVYPLFKEKEFYQVIITPKKSNLTDYSFLIDLN